MSRSIGAIGVYAAKLTVGSSIADGDRLRYTVKEVIKETPKTITLRIEDSSKEFIHTYRKNTIVYAITKEQYDEYEKWFKSWFKPKRA